MNLLFYQGVRRKLFPPIRSGRNQRRSTFGVSDMKIFVLFFRYLRPDAFIPYIRACSRVAQSDVNFLQYFHRLYGNLWSTRIFSSFDAMSHLVSIMNSAAGGAPLSDIINASFGWAGTQEGGDFWRDIHHLFGHFRSFLLGNRIDTNTLSLRELDSTLYPMLHESREFAFHVVDSLPVDPEDIRINTGSPTPEAIQEDINSVRRPRRVRVNQSSVIDAINQAASTIESQQNPTPFEVRDIRYDVGSNTYSYINEHGERITFTTPSGFSTSGNTTVTFISPEDIIPDGLR